ncbi:hydrolase TatD, partial [Pseudomonas syringae pv. actinidiae]|nr:hydrolase TatD [Pseudomonas syringae pv. actinidiae]
MLVDSHCHLDRLDLTQHDGSLDARGVGHFLCIGVSADNAGAVKALADRYADVDCSVGIHPLDVKPGE